ncbi:MAG: class I SAM-dependent methyltransferase [Promethearchaeia archaeon]
MHKIYYISKNPKCTLWDGMWSSRTIDQELEACKIEWAPKLMFLKYLDKENKIIDAGCGFGKWVIFLKNRGYNIIGIDNNEIAISKLKTYDNTLNIQYGDILNLDFPDNSFDAYISMGVVEHFLEGPDKALKEAYRIIKPGGLLFLSTPTVNIIRKIFGQFTINLINKLPNLFSFILEFFNKNKKYRNKKDKNNKDRFKHFIEYRFTISELQAYIRKNNFEILETVPHDFPGSRKHAIGLAVDFPFFKAPYSVNFKLNFLGIIISNILNSLSPWIASASTLYVARANK